MEAVNNMILFAIAVLSIINLIIEIEDVSGVVDTLVDLGESSEGSVVAPSFVEFSKYLEESKVSIEGNLTKSLQHLQSGELESASQYLGQAEERAEICGKLYRDLQA